MSSAPDPQKKPQKPASKPAKPTQPAEPEIDAYELDDEPAPAATKAPAINKSFLMDDGKPEPSDSSEKAPGKKESSSKKDEPAPGLPKMVDPTIAKQRREDARKKAAEDFALEEARRKKKKLVITALLLIVGVVVYFVFVKK